MLDGNTTDTIEGSALSFKKDYIDIYSCAWGPKDDGKRFGRPGTLASKALELGVKEVRGLLNVSFLFLSSPITKPLLSFSLGLFAVYKFHTEKVTGLVYLKPIVSLKKISELFTFLFSRQGDIIFANPTVYEKIRDLFSTFFFCFENYLLDKPNGFYFKKYLCFFDSEFAECPNDVCNASLSNRAEMVSVPYLFGQREMEDLQMTIVIVMVIPLVFTQCLLVLSVIMV